MVNLGELLHESGRVDEAEEFWRRAADLGETVAMYNLGISSRDAGRAADAERWLREAAEGGHASAMNNLAALLADTDRLDEAETWCERAKPRSGGDLVPTRRRAVRTDRHVPARRPADGDGSRHRGVGTGYGAPPKAGTP